MTNRSIWNSFLFGYWTFGRYFCYFTPLSACNACRKRQNPFGKWHSQTLSLYVCSVVGNWAMCYSSNIVAIAETFSAMTSFDTVPALLCLPVVAKGSFSLLKDIIVFSFCIWPWYSYYIITALSSAFAFNETETLLCHSSNVSSIMVRCYSIILQNRVRIRKLTVT